MADFSSRGQNRAAPDIIKPDVTAPGVNILAGASPTPYDPAGTGAPGQLFQAISGTSMSSPHVAGLFALLRQAHPDWSAAMAKSAVMTTARQDVTKEDASTPADPFDMGAGHVDPAGRPSRGGSMFSPGLVYDVGLFDYYGFLCDAAPSVFPDPDATCAALEGGGYATTAANLNLASIGDASFVGSTTVQRTVTSVNGSTRRYIVDDRGSARVRGERRAGEHPPRARRVGHVRGDDQPYGCHVRRVELRRVDVDERRRTRCAARSPSSRRTSPPPRWSSARASRAPSRCPCASATPARTAPRRTARCP